MAFRVAASKTSHNCKLLKMSMDNLQCVGQLLEVKLELDARMVQDPVIEPGIVNEFHDAHYRSEDVL